MSAGYEGILTHLVLCEPVSLVPDSQNLVSFFSRMTLRGLTFMVQSSRFIYIYKRFSPSDPGSRSLQAVVRNPLEQKAKGGGEKRKKMHNMAHFSQRKSFLWTPHGCSLRGRSSVSLQSGRIKWTFGADFWRRPGAQISDIKPRRKTRSTQPGWRNKPLWRER